MTRKKYSREEVARLGGLTAAHNMTPEQRSERARKGGMAVMERYGKAHMLRLRLNQRLTRQRPGQQSGPEPTTTRDTPRLSHMTQITTLTPEAHPGDAMAAAGDSLTLPGQSAYDYFGRQITDPALAECAVPNSPEMALRWAVDQLDSLRMVIASDVFVFTPENVASCVAFVLDGIEARS